jgi:tetratricopeptide (TPR) repeat protein
MPPAIPRFLAAALFVASVAARAGAQGPVPAPPPPSFEALFARALELHQAGDLFGAIDSYKAALELDPSRPEALTNMGAAYVRLGEYDEAIQHYEQALALDPNAGATRLNLALAFYKSARPVEAIPHLRRVLASDPEARNAYLVLAECYLQTGQEADLIALLQPREAIFEGDLAYAYLLGTALLRTDNAAEGQKYVDRIFGAGESAEAHLLMGIAYLGQHDYPSAKTELETALRLNARLPTLNSLYGRSLLALSEREQAERAFRRELELNVNDFEANLQLGNMRKAEGRFDESSVYLERAVAIRPTDLSGRKLLASLRLQTGRTEEAVAMLEALAKDAPGTIEVHVQLATAYNRLKRPDDAQREREIAERLTAEEQAKQPGAKPGPGGR